MAKMWDDPSMDPIADVRDHIRRCESSIGIDLRYAQRIRERKIRIAEGIAEKVVARELWTQEEADEFLEGVRERVEGTC